jgi:hypothetical protein
MTDTRHRIKIHVGAALECAEDATRTTNDLVAHTLEAAVTAKGVATTMHHAYSAQCMWRGYLNGQRIGRVLKNLYGPNHRHVAILDAEGSR